MNPGAQSPGRDPLCRVASFPAHNKGILRAVLFSLCIRLQISWNLCINRLRSKGLDTCEGYRQRTILGEDKFFDSSMEQGKEYSMLGTNLFYFRWLTFIQISGEINDFFKRISQSAAPIMVSPSLLKTLPTRSTSPWFSSPAPTGRQRLSPPDRPPQAPLPHKLPSMPRPSRIHAAKPQPAGPSHFAKTVSSGGPRGMGMLDFVRVRQERKDPGKVKTIPCSVGQCKSPHPSNYFMEWIISPERRLKRYEYKTWVTKNGVLVNDCGSTTRHCTSSQRVTFEFVAIDRCNGCTSLQVKRLALGNSHEHTQPGGLWMLPGSLCQTAQPQAQLHEHRLPGLGVESPGI